MARWRIGRVEGLDMADFGTLPGAMGPKRVEAVLQRLFCPRRPEQEIVTAFLPRRSCECTGLLKRVGTGKPIAVGCGDVRPYAEREAEAAPWAERQGADERQASRRRVRGRPAPPRQRVNAL